VRFTKSEDEIIRRSWTRLLQLLAAQYADQDLRRRKPGKVMAFLDRLAEPRAYLRAEGEAVGVIERVLGRDGWLAVIAIWNACCAALLVARLPDELRASLEVGWRTAGIGPTPLDRLNAEPS
jgi:hypothetical protein